MSSGRCTGWLAVLLLVGAAGLLMPAAATPARAQQQPAQSEQQQQGRGADPQMVSGTNTPSAMSAAFDMFQLRNSSTQTVQLGDWIGRGTFGAGMAYNDNVFGEAKGGVGAWALALRPAAIATQSNGIHTTEISAFANALIYTSPVSNGAGQVRDNTISGRAAITHDWEIMRDLTARFSASYFHGYYYPGVIAYTDAGKPVYADQTGYNQVDFNAVIHKEFNSHLFTDLKAAYNYISYDTPAPVSAQSAVYIPGSDNNTTTFGGRVGWSFSPATYVFVEPLAKTLYDSDAGSSLGYVATAGFGFRRLSLFSGEIFAGYQSQTFDDASIGTLSAPAFGGRISWEATRKLTLLLRADQTIAITAPYATVRGDNSVVVASNLAKTLTESLSFNYEISHALSVAGSLFNIRTASYGNSSSDKDAYGLGLAGTYRLRERWSAVASYQFTRQNGKGDADNSYSQNMVSLSLSGQL